MEDLKSEIATDAHKLRRDLRCQSEMLSHSNLKYNSTLDNIAQDYEHTCTNALVRFKKQLEAREKTKPTNNCVKSKLTFTRCTRCDRLFSH